MIYYIGRYGVTYALAKTVQSARSIAYDLAKMNLNQPITISNKAFEKMDTVNETLHNSVGFALCSDPSRNAVVWVKYVNKRDSTVVDNSHWLHADGSLGQKRW